MNPAPGGVLTLVRLDRPSKFSVDGNQINAKINQQWLRAIIPAIHSLHHEFRDHSGLIVNAWKRREQPGRALPYAQAEPLYKRSLSIREKVLAPDHPDIAHSLGNLAEVYRAQGQFAQAEPLCIRAPAISEKALGPDHPDVATGLANLAHVYFKQGLYAQAEPLYKRALAIYEKALGPNHPSVAMGLNNLALLYQAQGEYETVEPLSKRARAIQAAMKQGK